MLSAQLCNFLQLEECATMDQSNVLRKILKYIDQNGLRNGTSLTMILDDKLKQLFNCADDVIHFEKMWKCTKAHFIEEGQLDHTLELTKPAN